MADTVTFQTTALATPPSGTVVGTDEVTIGAVLQHLQRVKLFDGTDGGTLPLVIDANGADVDVTRLPTPATLYAGTNALTTTAEALAATQAIKGVLVQADPANTTNVLVGNSTAQHIRLGPDGGAIYIEIDDIAKVWVKMETGTGNVFYLADG